VALVAAEEITGSLAEFAKLSEIKENKKRPLAKRGFLTELAKTFWSLFAERAKTTI
jgi:hypothetical protein